MTMSGNTNNSSWRSFDPLGSKQTAPASSSSWNANSAAAPAMSYLDQQQQQQQYAYLKSYGFSSGMIRAFYAQRNAFPVRIWMLDNSSFMLVRDAHLLCNNQQQQQQLPVTRWEELQETVAFHSDTAARFSLPSRFALLNDPQIGPQYWSIAQTAATTTTTSSSLQEEQQLMHRVMSRAVPHGPTPLIVQLRILRDYIVSIAPQLPQQQQQQQHHHQTVPIIIATQGLPTDPNGISSPDVVNEFVQTLRSFAALPVCFVVRLCTDDEKAFDFYNALELGSGNHYQQQQPPPLSLDVLDDFYSEALEVYLRNPWLSYGLGLHRYREMGFRVPVLDILDERALYTHELTGLVTFFFDIPASYLPDPVTNWLGFLRAVETCMSREQLVWNPIKRAAVPWIDLKHLHEVYGPCVPGTASSWPTNSQTSTPGTTQHDPHSFVAPNSQVSSYPLTSNLTASELVKAIDIAWAKHPPAHVTTKSLAELLSTIHATFALVARHEHLGAKLQPFSATALASGETDVLKRAVRKIRFVMHPDRLPKDLSDQQALLCRTVWDTISEAWDVYSASASNST